MAKTIQVAGGHCFLWLGLPVAVLADGVNADEFNGYYDNTDIFDKLAEMLNVQ